LAQWRRRLPQQRSGDRGGTNDSDQNPDAEGVVITLWIGLTFGAGSWSAIRGRGSIAGLALAMLMGAIGASVGWLAGQALAAEPSPGSRALGAVVGGLLAAIVIVVGWGPRPRVVDVPAPPPG
jgi:hypothetical protein